MILLVILAAMSGCASIEYYGQAAAGHLSLMSSARSMDEVIADTETDADVRQRLRKIPAALNFARRELGLPDNGSYRDYADLKREAVNWVVFHTDRYSTRLKPSCFLVVGCLGYQGWFAKSDAESAATVLRETGHDVYLAGSPAYSSLGWFADPVLNTMLRWDDVTLIGVIFHELTHQKIYVAGDSAFNESLANFVEDEGVRRYLLSSLDADRWQRYRQQRARRQAFREMIVRYREQLSRAYADSSDDAQRARDKRRLIQYLRAEFQTRVDLDPAWRGYAHWIYGPMNNAKLASVSLYNRFSPAFASLLKQQDGDLRRFWAEVEKLAAMPLPDRHQRLEALLSASRPQ